MLKSNDAPAQHPVDDQGPIEMSAEMPRGVALRDKLGLTGTKLGCDRPMLHAKVYRVDASKALAMPGV